MEFLDGAATWFRNARIVTADRVFLGRLKVEDGRIEEVLLARASIFRAIVCCPASSNCTPTTSNRITRRGRR
jgi:hypothetical protein